MRLCIASGEIGGLAGVDTIPGISEGVLDEDLNDPIRVVQHGVATGEWNYNVHRSSAGVGGDYALANVVSYASLWVMFGIPGAPPGWNPTQVFIRTYLHWPTAAAGFNAVVVSLYDSYNSFDVVSELRIDSAGTATIWTTDDQNLTLRGTAYTPIVPENSRWWPITIMSLFDGTDGAFSLWYGFDFTSGPLLSTTGDTLQFGALGKFSQVRVTLPQYGGAVDDLVIQDISQRFVLPYGTLPLGDTAEFYDGTGVNATGDIVVGSGSYTTLQFLIGDKTLTGVAGARTPGLNDFDMAAGSSDAVRDDIIAAINDPANAFAPIATAASGGSGTVDLTAAVPGDYRNSTPLSILAENPTSITSVTAFAGGANGALLGTARLDNYYVSPESTNLTGRGVAGYALVEDAATVPWDFLKAHDPLIGAVYVQGDAWSALTDTPDGGLDADSGIPGDTFFAPVLLPEGAGSTSDLTPTGSSNNWENVDTSLETGVDATFNEATTVGLEDSYEMEDSALVSGDIARVVSLSVFARVDRDGTDILYGLPLLVSDSTTDYGLALTLPETFGPMQRTWMYDPDTSTDWTLTTVAAVEAGIRFE